MPDSPGISGPPAPKQERRVWVRHACDVPSSYQRSATAADVPSWARVRDVSRGGIKLLINRHFETGDWLQLEVEGTDQEPSRTMVARVVHATAQDAATWAVGCAFAQPLGEDDLLFFQQQRSKPLTADDRAHVRFPCNVEAAYRAVGDEEALDWPARVLDISAGGIGLLVKRRFEPGAVLSLELKDKSGQLCRSVLARVAHVTPKPDGDWVLGCMFAKTMSEDDVEAFL